MLRLALGLMVFALAVMSDSAAAQTAPLQVGAAVERSLAPKDAAHEFAVTIPANQAFTVTVRQQGIDVVVTVLDPAGKQLAQVDAASEDHGRGGSEVARVSALTPGEYRVRVAPFERPDARPAKYTIALTERRALTADERIHAQSEREIAEVERRWEAAIDALDLPTLTGILRKDGFAMGPVAGATRTREQVIAGWEEAVKERAKLGLSQSHTISEHVIRAARDTGVSTGRFLITQTSRDHGQSRFSGQFVHVWAKDADGWKLVGDYTFPYGRAPRTAKTPPPAVSAAVLSAYAGTYRGESGPASLSFTVENGALTMQWITPLDTSPKMPLEVVSDTTFTAPGGDEITFVRSAEGQVREVILFSDGPAARWTRADGPVGTPKPSGPR